MRELEVSVIASEARDLLFCRAVSTRQGEEQVLRSLSLASG
jgi:hypothetical protein